MCLGVDCVPSAGDEGTDPFPDDPPEHVRAVRYRYRFTTPTERDATGDWWDRQRVGTYFGPVSLDDSRFRRTLERMGWGLPEGRESSDDSETGGRPNGDG